jgi:FkbM family methyltransferase
MKLAKGWAWPDADEFMVNELASDGTYQGPHLQEALRLVHRFDLAIDGGAHVGTWSKVMSGRFDRVIACEPSPDTFACLAQNMATFGCTNVDPRNLALGREAGAVRMTLDPDQEARANTGARFVKAGGEIPVETIDSWQLPSLGFLKLDIEGSEFDALQGAVETLKRCKPVVLFENKWLWTRHYGHPKNAVANFLTRQRYHFLGQAMRDQIWGPA